jgi:GLPGLI family protein
MKKVLMTACALLPISLLIAQQKEGKVLYERVSQMQIRINMGGEMNEAMQNMLPKTRKDNFELTFGNNQSLWKQAESNEEEPISENGMQIRMVMAGANDVLYNNLDNKTRVEQRELFDKTFIIDDSIRPLKWKMTTESKMILNHNCMKAMATQYGSRMQMTMDNGKMERKEVQDTTEIVAWFTTDIPVPAGPAEYQGQLPGLILEMDIAKGRQVYRAMDISSKADLASIKAPTGKKHFTPEQFKKEREKMLDEMQRNGGGPGRTFRFGGN